jgi:hypothetical protein
LLLHLGEFELENVVSFFAGASAALRMSVMNEQKSVGDALNESQARGAIVTRQHVDSYFKTISELERTPYGRDYAFVDFPNVKMLLQTGRDPIPGFYSYESTFVSGAMPDPLPAILQQLTGESEVAFSLSDKKKSFSHAALIKVFCVVCLVFLF